MAELKNFTVYRGDDYLLRFVMTANGGVSGWTTKFTVRKTTRAADPAVVSLPGTVLDPGGFSSPGIFEVDFSKAQTLMLEARLYVYSMKRTNSGTNAVLTEGVMTVKSDILNALP